MRTDLNGKVALVTGGGSGLGEATARALAGAGCSVACLDVNGEAAERVAQALEGVQARNIGLRCDVSDAQSVSASVNRIAQQLGRLDYAINCAAIDYTVSVDDLSIEQWDRVIGVNLRGPFLISKAAMPEMRKQGGGHIVNIASTAATRAWANASAYIASKSGLVGLGRAIGVEGREDNIKVTTVIPGGMRTHFFDRFVEQGIPMPDQANLQPPENVAEVILAALLLPADSALQEVIVTPLTETSWP